MNQSMDMGQTPFLYIYFVYLTGQNAQAGSDLSSV